MKTEITVDEVYHVSVKKKIEIEVPNDVEDVETYVREYLDSDEGVDELGDADADESWSDVVDIYVEVEPEGKEIITFKEL